MKISLILLFILGTTNISGFSTIEPRFQLSFDGFVMFLKELAALRSRYQKVKETGNILSRRLDYLETEFLKTNMTVGLPIEKMSTLTKNTRNLDIRMKNITSVVDVAKHKMVKLQESTNNTKQGRFNLSKLAEKKDRAIVDLIHFIENLTSSTDEFQNTSFDLKSEKDNFTARIDEISKTTEPIEMMGCESGYGYDNSGLASNTKTTTLRYPRPFDATPSVWYGLSRLEVGAMNYNYPMNFEVTLSGVNNSGMSVNIQKNSYTSLKESEYTWMACYV